VVHRVDYCDVQRIVHHVVEVEHREARVEVGGNARSADLAMPSARAAASCAASPRAGVHRHARVTEGIFYGSRRARLLLSFNTIFRVLDFSENLDRVRLLLVNIRYIT
jgi:hypothetical protein